MCSHTNRSSEHPLTSSPIVCLSGNIYWRNYTLALIFIDFTPFDMQKRVFLAQHYACPERFPRYVSPSSVLNQIMQQILLKLC